MHALMFTFVFMHIVMYKVMYKLDIVTYKVMDKLHIVTYKVMYKLHVMYKVMYNLHIVTVKCKECCCVCYITTAYCTTPDQSDRTVSQWPGAADQHGHRKREQQSMLCNVLC